MLTRSIHRNDIHRNDIHRNDTDSGAHTDEADGSADRTRLRAGDPVQVRNRFEGRWTHGFSIASSSDDGYQLRRASDGAILPAWFPHDMVRRCSM